MKYLLLYLCTNSDIFVGIASVNQWKTVETLATADITFFFFFSIAHLQSRPYLVGPPCPLSVLDFIAWSSSALQSTLSGGTGERMIIVSVGSVQGMVSSNVSNGWPKHFDRALSTCTTSEENCEKGQTKSIPLTNQSNS